MLKIFRFIAGYKKLRIPRQSSAQTMNICRQFGYIYRDTSFDDDFMYFYMPLRTAKHFGEKCKDFGIELFEISESGIPHLFSKYHRRYGVAAGVLLFTAIIFLSGRVIWDIRINGNQKLSESEVLTQLNECGLSVGNLKSKTDTSTVENRIMILSPDIGWISINLIGTVAEVEIRESEVIEEKEEYLAANIVAAKDGQIYLFENVRGNILCDIGDFVSAGELIVSGIYESETQGLRYTAAKGEVFAKTTEEISVEIPLKYDKKVYTGKVFTEKYLIFFKKEIKFFGNGGNSYTDCDKIDTVEYLDILSAGKLPFGVRTVKYFEYAYESTERTEDEARKLADYKLQSALSILASKTELLGKSTEESLSPESFKLFCKIECIENIAEIREIKIKELPPIGGTG